MEHPIMYVPVCRLSGEATIASIGLFGKVVLPMIKDWWEAHVDAEWRIPIPLEQWGFSRCSVYTGRVSPNRWHCPGKQSSDK